MSRLEQLLDLLKQDPNDNFLNYALALEYAKVNEYIKAISIIEAILKKDENYLGGYYQLGQMYEQAAQLENAKVTYAKGIEIARKQKNNKALGEMNTALMLLDDI